MKRFLIEQSNANIVSHRGLALMGQAVKQHTNLAREIDSQVPLRHGIKHSSVIKSYLAMRSVGKNDFEAIHTIESKFYFMSAIELDDIPSEATLRQRMDNNARIFLPIALFSSLPIMAHQNSFTVNSKRTCISSVTLR